MTLGPRRHLILQWVRAFFGSAPFARALSLTAVGTAFCAHAIRSTVGWPGLIGALATLVVLAAVSFIAHRGSIEWQGLLPISLLAFVSWSAISLIWSNNPSWTLVGVGYQIVLAFLAVYVALVRDTIQVVRLIGDVLRVLLGVSLGLEVLSGLLIDMPIAFLGIQGNLAYGGPIQGLFGTRNQLGFVALIGFVTFLVEWRTRSVRRGTGAFSIALATLCLLLSGSPTVAVALVVVGVATLALFGLRAVAPHARRGWQVVLVILTLISLVIAFVIRTRIIDFLNGRSEFQARYTLWIQIWQLIPVNPLQGWGWVGRWPADLAPYSWINFAIDAHQRNALNAFLDVTLQLGLIGLLAFIGLLALALGRSWLLAANKHSVIYIWSPLILLALIVTSAFESTVLVEGGWMLLVICSIKAAQGMSWRLRLTAPVPPGLPHR
ncbi:MAG: O-antigen ligase family protein [Microbacteriaceae bacterium]